MPRTTPSISQYQSQIQELPPQTMEKPIQESHQNVMSTPSYNTVMLQSDQYVQNSSYPIISKLNPKSNNGVRPKHSHSHGMPSTSYTKSLESTTVFQGYNPQGVTEHVILNDRIQCKQ